MNVNIASSLFKSMELGCIENTKGTLLVTVAQDGNNKFLPIAFVVVEGETVEIRFVFLNNLKMHVTSQNDLCLLSDRHESIKSVYSRRDSG